MYAFSYRVYLSLESRHSCYQIHVFPSYLLWYIFFFCNLCRLSVYFSLCFKFNLLSTDSGHCIEHIETRAYLVSIDCQQFLLSWFPGCLFAIFLTKMKELSPRYYRKYSIIFKRKTTVRRKDTGYKAKGKRRIQVASNKSKVGTPKSRLIPAW